LLIQLYVMKSILCLILSKNRNRSTIIYVMAINKILPIEIMYYIRVSEQKDVLNNENYYQQSQYFLFLFYLCCARENYTPMQLKLSLTITVS